MLVGNLIYSFRQGVERNRICLAITVLMHTVGHCCMFRQTSPYHYLVVGERTFSVLLQFGLGESRNWRRENWRVCVQTARSKCFYMYTQSHWTELKHGKSHLQI